MCSAVIFYPATRSRPLADFEPRSKNNFMARQGQVDTYNKGGDVEGGFKNLDPNVRIVVARPFIEHTMHNVIMAVAGRDTGATLFGPAECATCESNPRPLLTRTLTFGSVVPRSMQLSANTQVKSGTNRHSNLH